MTRRQPAFARTMNAGREAALRAIRRPSYNHGRPPRGLRRLQARAVAPNYSPRSTYSPIQLRAVSLPYGAPLSFKIGPARYAADHLQNRQACATTAASLAEAHATRAGADPRAIALPLCWGRPQNRSCERAGGDRVSAPSAGWTLRKVSERTPRGVTARVKFFWHSLSAWPLPATSRSPPISPPRPSSSCVFQLVSYPLGAIGFITRPTS